MDSPFFMDKRMEAQFGRLTADVFSSNIPIQGICI